MIDMEKNPRRVWEKILSPDLQNSGGRFEGSTSPEERAGRGAKIFTVDTKRGVYLS